VQWSGKPGSKGARRIDKRHWRPTFYLGDDSLQMKDMQPMIPHQAVQNEWPEQNFKERKKRRKTPDVVDGEVILSLGSVRDSLLASCAVGRIRQSEGLENCPFVWLVIIQQNGSEIHHLATSEAGVFQVAELLLECPGMTFLFVGSSLEFAADLVLSSFVQSNVFLCILSLFPSHFVFPLIL
jgi:hypothetical protein